MEKEKETGKVEESAYCRFMSRLMIELIMILLGVVLIVLLATAVIKKTHKEESRAVTLSGEQVK